jgi:hypothetical protein
VLHAIKAQMGKFVAWPLLKGNVCLGSEYGISNGVGHISTLYMFPTS